METIELIERLSQGAAPVPRHAAAMRLWASVAAGGILSFAAMWLWLGIRPDLTAALSTSAYWMKFGYTLALAAAAFWTVERAGRPGADTTLPVTLIVVPVVAIFLLATVQLAGAGPDQRMKLMMGASSHICPWRIAILSLPLLAAILINLRSLAPTRLVGAGAAAGLLAGAVGAWIYAFHCDESAAPFVAIWYSFGLAMVGALGGLLGKWLLRW